MKTKFAWLRIYSRANENREYKKSLIAHESHPTYFITHKKQISPGNVFCWHEPTEWKHHLLIDLWIVVIDLQFKTGGRVDIINNN